MSLLVEASSLAEICNLIRSCLPFLDPYVCFLAPRDVWIIWLSSILVLSVSDEGCHRNVPCTHSNKYAFYLSLASNYIFVSYATDHCLSMWPVFHLWRQIYISIKTLNPIEHCICIWIFCMLIHFKDNIV